MLFESISRHMEERWRKWDICQATGRKSLMFKQNEVDERVCSGGAADKVKRDEQ